MDGDPIHDHQPFSSRDGRRDSERPIMYKDIAPPNGEKITRDQQLNVPDNPIIPVIRGDGTGPDIWAASVRVMDAAVKKAYCGQKKISWFEVFAGRSGTDTFEYWRPDVT